MLTPGNVLYGKFSLDKDKFKYCIVLHRDNSDVEHCILTTFTTSQRRSILNPKHGKNELTTDTGKKILSYVFKAGMVVGKNNAGEDFSFPKDSTVVPDYGMDSWTLNSLRSVDGLTLKCTLSKDEFGRMLHTLLRSERLELKYKHTIEDALTQLYNPTAK